MESDQIESFISAFGMTGYTADKVRSGRFSDDLQLFIVENKNKKRELFLSESSRFALHLAVGVGHLQDIKNGKVFIPNDSFYRNALGFQGAVNRAISKRQPGHLKREGEFAIVNGEVFTPIGPV